MKIDLDPRELDKILHPLVDVSEEPKMIELILRVAHDAIERYLHKYLQRTDTRIFVKRDNATGKLRIVAFCGEEDAEERAFIAAEGN